MSDERDIIEIAEARLGEALSKKFPNRVFDPTMIFGIMEMIFQLIEKCRDMRESRLVKYMKKPRRRHKYRARIRVQRAHPDWPWSDVDDAVTAMFEVGSNATDDERLEMVHEVRAD